MNTPVNWSFGRPLEGWAWQAERERGRVLLTHGLAEYTHRYEPLIQDLRGRGYSVYGFDQRGHGRSSGTRALVDVDAFVDDHIAARAALLEGRTPLFAFGHSLGGLVTALSVLRDPRGLAGVVLSSPALLVGSDLPAPVRAVSQLLGRLAPTAPTIELSSAHLAQDASVGARYDADELVYRGRVRAGTGASMMRAGASLWARAHTWRVPTLVIHGDADRLADVNGSRRFSGLARSEDFTYTEIPGGYHELFNDHTRQDLIRDLLAWLDGRTRTP
ncbi:alpha/beta hydrolase [Deinococcus maricopensis]|uniref:Alpha/beta hydrolase fold protein n=1 Tax=Deinococcus maricopensis (strain DSM 21211 / LMG 22137 / NRRL B-23946 / LB-34) TaxID=709986 RepID=E8U8R0_DEIML|nr:alpha/beta hydrolase [Deinococcus maricopensis]ADV67449.1 alpha/beta hydrolase fold protein [Deinococcus maricopensis DSM 21211]